VKKFTWKCEICAVTLVSSSREQLEHNILAHMFKHLKRREISSLDLKREYDKIVEVKQ